MQVGFREGRAKDTTRRNWDGDGPRPLAWAGWYPASDDSVEQEVLVGPAEAPWFKLGSAARDAPLDGKRQSYPVVLLSHGTGGMALGMEWLGRRLAQRGFIALAVNHHGNTGLEPYRPEGFLCLWERARDLTVLLDSLDSRGEFAGRLDMDRVFVAGFSAGAYTALAFLGAVTAFSRFQPVGRRPAVVPGPREFPALADHVPALLANNAVFRDSWSRMSDSYRDGRVKAALVCAPGRSVLSFSEESLAEIDTPMRIVVGGADKIAPPKECAAWLHKRLRASRLEILPDAGHYVFVPEATELRRRAEPEVWADAPTVDRRAVHEKVTASAAELFQAV
jgi:predicted dienelactone hydrolase